MRVASLLVLSVIGVSLALVFGRANADSGDLTTTQAAERSAPVAVYEPDRLEVRFVPDATPQEIEALLRHDGVHSIVAIPHVAIRIVKVKPTRLQEVERDLGASPIVAHVERDEEVELFAVPNDTDYEQQWGIRVANFPAAWPLARARTVRVAVVDTGVDQSVPDLAGRVVASVEVVSGGGQDPNGHGTAVAGIIAARTGNRHGGAGACPVCRIISVRVLDARASGDLGLTADGIVKAADLGARVINLSLGSPEPFDALEKAIAYARSKGALVIAAAGNDGTLVPFWPARYPGVLSVGASTEEDALYDWSQRGTWVKVTAPGCNVAPRPNGQYELFCGTSSAAPLVAAAAAMMFAIRPRATPDQVMAKILATSRRVQGVATGRVDVGRAVRSISR